MPELVTSNRTDTSVQSYVAAVGCAFLLAVTPSSTAQSTSVSATAAVTPEPLAISTGNATDNLEVVAFSSPIVWDTAERVAPLAVSADAAEFCTRHTELEALLDQAPLKVASVFGDEHELRLELFVDPDHGTEQLFIVVRTGLPPKRADELQTRLEDEWFFEAMAAANGNLGLSLEFA